MRVEENNQIVNTSLQEYREKIETAILQALPDIQFPVTSPQAQLRDVFAQIAYNNIELPLRRVVSGMDPRGASGYFLDATAKLFDLNRLSATNLVVEIDVTNNDTVSKNITESDIFNFLYNGENLIFDVLSPVTISASATELVTIKSEQARLIEVFNGDSFTLVGGGGDITAVYTKSNPAVSRDFESDQEYYVRLQKSKSILGEDSKASIASAILSIDDGFINFARVFDINDKDDAGIPLVGTPGNILTLVNGIISDGGITDNTIAIAKAIQSKVAGGVYTIGSIERFVQDSNGQTISVKFSPPDAVVIDVQMEVFSKTGDPIPDNFQNLVEDAIGLRLLDVDLGQDIYFSFISEGVGNATEIAGTYVTNLAMSVTGGTFSQNTISINPLQVGVLGTVTLL